MTTDEYSCTSLNISFERTALQRCEVLKNALLELTLKDFALSYNKIYFRQFFEFNFSEMKPVLVRKVEKF